MILNVHLDASYISAKNAKSCAAGHFFLGWKPDDKRPIRLNGPILTLCTILKFVAASAAEAELGAVYLKCKRSENHQTPTRRAQPHTIAYPMHCENTTAVGIANNTVKQQRWFTSH